MEGLISAFHLFSFLFVISFCYASIPAANVIRLHTSLKVNTTWKAAEGTVLLTNSDLGCGFSTVTCQNGNRCFVLSVSFLGEDGGFKPDRVIWAANGNTPLPPDSTLNFTLDGDLQLKDPRGRVTWSTNTSGLGVTKMVLKKSGNLALVSENGTEIWRSFNHPTDTLMPGQNLMPSSKLQSFRSSFDLRTGAYTLLVENRSVTLYTTLFRYATWSVNDGVNLTISRMVLTRTGDLQLVSANGTAFDRIRLKIVQKKFMDKRFLFMRLGHDGSLKLFFQDVLPVSLNSRLKGSKFKVAAKGSCALPNKCQSYGICSGAKGNCSCPSSNHFRLVGKTCRATQPLVCANNSNHRLLELPKTDYFSTHFLPGVPVISIEDCKRRCMENCSCAVAIFRDTTSGRFCYQFKNVLSLINVTGTNSSAVAFVRVEEHPSRRARVNRRVTLWVAVSLGAVTLLLLPVGILYMNYLKRTHRSDELLESIPGVPRRFTFMELREATANFTRKLGRGGFGTVYHGTLEDGTKVAVKRLETTKGGGDDQFKAEVFAIGSVHHSNLVRLIGFCCDDQKHALLVYEYMPNGSLDSWIFHDKLFDWKTRSKVALDIAKGLAYLHEGCEQSVLHLDIKPQNILLDVEFKAKISDFGLAIFAKKGLKLDARGTPGYMAPEWRTSQVSAKIDVYSFGIVLLEILSGKQALQFLDAMKASHNVNVEKVDKESLLELLDPRLHGLSSGVNLEVERFVLVALCCIQDDPSTRPSMGDVVKMLEGNMDVPDVLLSLKFQVAALPLGIASFLASKSH